jgi:SAM-dependent methyltransferase
VGCGSGWLSEYFARLGYELTGIDISPELIRIAAERVSKLPYAVDRETPIHCKFLVHDIERDSLPQTFAAIVCYDSLHHFEDEHSVMKNLASMLDEGGQLFVAEGEKPTEGSAGEAELREVMEQYQTLEAPFTREYLLHLVGQYGFAIAGDYVAVTGFVDRDNVADHAIRFVESPSFNYLLCRKMRAHGPMLDSKAPGLLLARISLTSDWQEDVIAGETIRADVAVENIGDTLWLTSRAPLPGRVRIGLKILDERGETLTEIHGSPPLRKTVAPGEQVKLKLSVRAPTAPGRYTFKLDLLDQDIAWFEQHGSQPLMLQFTAKTPPAADG